MTSNYRRGNNRDPFSPDGDAGSWLLTSEGFLADLVWGTSVFGASYVTPISEVIGDIAKHTGMEVTLPCARNIGLRRIMNLTSGFISKPALCRGL